MRLHVTGWQQCDYVQHTANTRTAYSDVSVRLCNT